MTDEQRIERRLIEAAKELGRQCALWFWLEDTPANTGPLRWFWATKNVESWGIQWDWLEK